MHDNTDDLWKDILLKRCSAADFKNTLTLSDKSTTYQYQIFEVLVTETLARLYNDFDWKTSPIQHDGGVDFTAEKKVNNTNNSDYFPQLIIYGQIKRRKASISEKLVLDATSNIIRYYRKNAIQKKCLYEIIHVFSTDKNIISEIKKSIENIDNLHYCVRIINAEYLFKIWCLNKYFVHSIIDTALTRKEIELLDCFVEKNASSWDSVLNFKKTIRQNTSVGKIFECVVQIDSLLDIAFSVKVKWLPIDDTSILLVSPQSLLTSSPLTVKSINNKIIFEIKFIANSVGEQDLGSLQFISPFDQIIYQLPLGYVNVDKRFNPSFCEIPVASAMKEFRKVIVEHGKDALFYVVTGEGGIGKSKLLENIQIFAINHKYRSINIEHACNLENDRYIILQMLEFLCECEHKTNEKELYHYIRQFFGGFYRQKWDDDLQKFIYGDVVKNDDLIIECIFYLTLYALENNSLCITFSNMHWASPFLLSTLKVLIEYIKDNKFYLGNNIIFVFEGRSKEKINANYRKVTPHDWFEFCDSNILKKIKLNKWTSKTSAFYIRALFEQPQTLIENSDLENMQKLLLKYSSGNPMHINEMIKHMLTERTLTLDNKGKLHILVTDAANKFSSEILDVISLRIQYFMEIQPQIMDYLIILANLILDDYKLYSEIINEVFQKVNIDIMTFFCDTGFIEKKNDLYFFTHEHYKTVLMQQKICDYNVVEEFLDNSRNKKRMLSGVSKIRLMLLRNEKTDFYMETVFNETMNCLRKSEKIFEQYALLQLLLDFPSSLLQKKGYPLYKIYRFLIDGAMVIANYNEAQKYIKKIIDEDDQSEDYYLNLVYAKKMLSNIYGLQMEIDDAISVGLGFITTLENYFDIYSTESNNLYKEYILLFDRVAIEYYMAGQYKQCEEYHETAQTLLEQVNDQYVKYHILYEQGVRELHQDVSEGVKHINDSLENIPIYDFMTEGQEKDLILGDLLMGMLLEAKTESQVNEIKEQALVKCLELATSLEPFEAILFHWIVGICFVLQQNFKEALRYFRISVIISAKTPIIGTLWKSYLNLAQAYLLFDKCESNSNKNCYKKTARYYIIEAKEIIEEALERNVWTRKDLKRRLSYPMSLINWLLESEPKDVQFKDDSPLHIDFDKYSFFMLD